MAARKKFFQKKLIVFGLIAVGVVTAAVGAKLFSKSSKFVSLDEEWNKYTNHKLGFSIWIPKASMNGYGDCEWKGDEGDPSYRPVGKMTKLKVFEHKGGAYIAHEYVYELSGKTEKPDGRTWFSDCNKEMNSVERLKEDKTNIWHIEVEKITSEEELENFMKRRWGSGCSVGEKTPAEQEGVFNVEIEGDGKSPNESECHNFFVSFEIRHYPEKQKVVTWCRGQDVSFWNEGYKEFYDGEMYKSFKFE